MQGDTIENNRHSSSGFLSPDGGFWRIDSSYKMGRIKREDHEDHEDLAEYIINLKGYEQNTRSAKDYLISIGWVAVSVQSRKLIYNSLAIRDNEKFQQEFAEYINRGFKEDDIGIITPRKITIRYKG